MRSVGENSDPGHIKRLKMPSSYSALANWDGSHSPSRRPSHSSSSSSSMHPPSLPPMSSTGGRAAKPDSSSHRRISAHYAATPLKSASGTPSLACPSSADDDESVQRMLFATQPSPSPSPAPHMMTRKSSPANRSASIGELMDVDWSPPSVEKRNPTPAPSTSTAQAKRPEIRLQIAALHTLSPSPTHSPTTNPSLFGSRSVSPTSEHADGRSTSYMHPSDDLEHIDIDATLKSFDDGRSYANIGTHHSGQSSKTEEGRTDNLAALDSTAGAMVPVDGITAQSTSVTDSTREPSLMSATVLERELSEAPVTPVLQFPESSLSPLPPTPQKLAGVAPGGTTSRIAARSPSVEIVDVDGSIGDNTLVADTIPKAALRTRTATRLRAPPPRQARPRAIARSPITVSSSSRSPSPVSHRPVRKSSNRMYVEVRQLRSEEKAKYLLPTEISYSSEDDKEAGPSQQPRQLQDVISSPLSPTVSDFEFSFSSRSRSLSSEIVRSTSPVRFVPSSVSPPPNIRSPSPREPSSSPLSSPVVPRPQPLQSLPDPSPDPSSVSGSSSQRLLEVVEQEEKYANGLVAAFQAAHVMNAIPSSSILKRKSSPAPRRSESNLTKPRKRKLSSPGPSAGPSQPPKKRLAQQHLGRPAALPHEHLRPRSPSVTYVSSADGESPGNKDIWVLEGLGDDAIDIVGQHSTYYALDVNLSTPFIGDRIPDPQRIQTTLIPAFRHLLRYLDIDPMSLIPGNKGSAVSREAKRRVPIPVTPKVVAEDPLSEPPTPPRIWEALQAAAARNEAHSTPKRVKKARVKKSPVKNPDATSTAGNSSAIHLATPERRPADAPQPQSQPQPQPQLSPNVAPAPTSSPNAVRSVPFAVFPPQVTPSQGLSYNYMQSHYNGFPANAVRGQDAFFGGHVSLDQDVRMDVDEKYPSGPPLPPTDFHTQDSYQDSALWMDPSHPLPSSLSENMTLDLGTTISPEPTSMSMGEGGYVGGNGTIDPSLLAGPSTPPRARSPTPTPTPPSLSLRNRGVDPPEANDQAEQAPDVQPQPQPNTASQGRGKGKGKGKGKERAQDVGFRARVQIPAVPPPATSSGPSMGEDVVSGRRARKPSARALEARATMTHLVGAGFIKPNDVDAKMVLGRKEPAEEVVVDEEEDEDEEDEVEEVDLDESEDLFDDDDDDDDEDEDEDEDRGVDREVSARQRRPKFSADDIKKLSTEIPYCHQCRNQNRYEKICCTVTKESGIQCSLYFCEKCIVLRYPHMTFNAYEAAFKCPKCMGTCNCTTCCKQRGEQYISTRGTKVNIAFSKIYADVPLRRNTIRSVPSSVPKPSRPASVTTGPKARPAPKPKPKPKPMTQTAEELKISAAMALPQGSVWGTIYGVKMDKIGIGFVVDDTAQGIVVRPDLGATPKGSLYSQYEESHVGTEEEEEEEEEVDQLNHDSSIAPTPPITQSTLFSQSVPSTVHSVASTSRLSTMAPSLPTPQPPRKGLFIGKPREYWKVHDATAGIPAPRGHVYIGDKEKVFERPDQTYTRYWKCMEGSLTPEPEDEENEGTSSQQATGSLSPHAAGEPTQELDFIIARMIKHMQDMPTVPTTSISTSVDPTSVQITDDVVADVLVHDAQVHSAPPAVGDTATLDSGDTTSNTHIHVAAHAVEGTVALESGDVGASVHAHSAPEVTDDPTVIGSSQTPTHTARHDASQLLEAPVVVEHPSISDAPISSKDILADANLATVGQPSAQPLAVDTLVLEPTLSD